MGLDIEPICVADGMGRIVASFNSDKRIVGPALIKFNISKLKNPNSARPSDSFKIDLKTKDSYLIGYQHDGLEI